jgi:glycerophosphoryl diester phosphodiesterase
MLEALNYPITTFELDVVVSKDGAVVVSHEPWMHPEICLDPKGKELKGKEVNLYKLTLEEIQQYDCGSRPHPRFPRQKKIRETKPALGQLLSTLEAELKKRNRSEMSYNIEIKSTPEDEKEGYQPGIKVFSDLVIAEVLKHLPAARFTIQSFDWRVLKYLHEKYPHVSLVALREAPYEAGKIEGELGFWPAVFSPDYKLLTKEDVAYFHSKKVKVIPWTVNSVEEMKKLQAMGVDGIITDYPDLILQMEGKKCEKGQSSFEGRCVKIPRNGLYSQKNPGWICKEGYIQKRNDCVKIKLPESAYFKEDGKTWVCQEGYERYRGKCKKL